MCAGRGARTSDGVGRAAPRHWYLIVLLTCAMAPLVACAPQSGARVGATAAHARQVNLLVPSQQAAPVTANDDQGLAPIPPAPGTSATAVFLMNPDTGGVYVQQNADEERAQASTTKIMTALVAVQTSRLDQRITVGPDTVLPASFNASMAGLHVGDVLTLTELLYTLLLPSGDDAAIAIADGVAGSQANFVLLMNAQAQLLGLRHTHFANVHGLDDPQQYSSARDLALLTARALEEPAIAQIVATPSEELPATADHADYKLVNTNELLSGPPYPGILGVKTGFTDNAGRCLVFAATSSQGRLIGVVLNEPSNAARFSDARALLDWGFTLERRLRSLRYLAMQPAA